MPLIFRDIKLYFLLVILVHLADNLHAQNVLKLNINNLEASSIATSTDTTFKKIIIVLPERNFNDINIWINNVRFSFKCEDTSIKRKTEYCFTLRASDIDSGKIVFRFNNKVLAAVNNTLFPYPKEVLTGKDTVEVKITAKDKSWITAIPFIKGATPTPSSSTPAGTGGGFKSETFCYDTDRLLKELGDELRPPILEMNDSVLLGRIDSILKKGKDVEKVIGELTSLVSKYQFSKHPELKATITNSIQKTSTFSKELKSNLSVPGLPGVSFLCEDTALAKKCNCGTPIQNQFQNMYLKPCFDPKGKAISVSNVLWFNTIEEDPARKIFLLKTKEGKKSKKSKPDCPDVYKTGFEFLRIKHRMSPVVDRILAIAVIAHKDSIITFDTSYVNYFLDSAMAAQNSFTNAGTKKIEPAVDSNKVIPETTKDTFQELKTATNLKDDLLYFNSKYSNQAFIQSYYDAELLCIQSSIVKRFELASIPKSGNSLATSIEEKLKATITNRGYYNYICSLLSSIASEYQAAITRKSDLKVFTKILQVPNADEFTVSVKGGKQANTLYSHKFNVSGGIKLDFSTGVFLTGVNDKEYVLSSANMRFLDSATTPDRQVDTTGNLIDVNTKKLNYSVGLMAHVYYRTGYFINAGIATGVTINNSDFMWLVGASVMFRMGNGRLSFVGGWAFGKENALDANHQQYLKSKVNTQLSSPNTITNVPRFFTETNISTYEKRKTGWFAGITYNFASIKL